MTSEALAPPRPLAAVPPPARRRGDPRDFQIGILAALLLYGVFALDFAASALHCAVLLGTALGAQYLCGRLAGLPRFDPKSPLISALSLCLLLRTPSLAIAAAAAVLAVGSKFALRHRGKHLFNPSNFALVAVMLASERAWVSPGQWGSAAFFAFAAACLGALVVRRAARSDVTWAFLAAYVGLLLGRALYLGDPLAIPLHQLSGGGFLIFTFFMISDPKTTPDSRAGRVAFAALVAAVAFWIRFGLHEPNGLLWALAACAPAVPLLDRLLPGGRYRWPGSVQPPTPATQHEENPMNAPTRIGQAALAALVLALAAAPAAEAFCGFYVARADTQLFNRASQVVLVRDGDRTVITMANDFEGDPSDFALVVPVPTFIEREQIHVADKALIDHLDAYTSPRLVEYFDENPCALYDYERKSIALEMSAAAPPAAQRRDARALGVTIEASYTVGEYDILILSAKESDGLLTWLTDNGYRLPRGAAPVVGSYLKQGMRFFVARVNLGEKARLGTNYLRPLQVAYETPKFMLPIRLGTVNAKGAQELFVYTLTRRGRVETANYRTVRLPSGVELPPFVEDEFGRFYRDLFSRQVERENGRAVFLEYAWDMSWCDPCAADPLSRRELEELGVFWLAPGDPGPLRRRPIPAPNPAQDVFVTRLHVRYDARGFPEDLVFHQTGDRDNFQGRFVLRHPWTGEATCRAAETYRHELARRQEGEAQTLARLTGWDIDDIRDRMQLAGPVPASDDEPWWRRLWGRNGR